jgi:hypothetical protein
VPNAVPRRQFWWGYPVTVNFPVIIKRQTNDDSRRLAAFKEISKRNIQTSADGRTCGAKQQRQTQNPEPG